MGVLGTRFRWGWSPLIVSLLIGLTGCRIPPFNVELAGALATASKMTERARFTVSGYSKDPADQELRFIPDKPGAFTNTGAPEEDPFDSGFIAVLRSNQLQLVYRPENGFLSGEVWAQKPFSPANSLQWRLETVGDGFERSLVIIGFGPPDGGVFDLMRWDYSSNGTSPPTAPPFKLRDVSSHAGLTYVSMHMFPSAGGGDIDVYALYNDGISLWEDEYVVSPFALGPFNHRLDEQYASGPPTPGLPASPGGYAFPYFRNLAAGLSYLSLPDGVAWKNYRWPSGTGPVTVLPSNRKVDALLTTGDLYSGRGGWGSVLDKDGNEKHRFPLGGLKLAYECYYKGTPTLVFTLALPMGDKHGSGADVEFRVYTLATKDVGKLAD